MGARDLRDAFNEAAAGRATCGRAFLNMVRQDGKEWQRLSFDGTWASGGPFHVESELLPGTAEVNAAARDTALKMLEVGEKQP